MKNILYLDHPELVPRRRAENTISLAGLAGGIVEIGTHSGIAVVSSQGVVTARKWGAVPGGTEYGTAAHPEDFAASDGGALHVTATVGESDHARSAPVRYAAPQADALPAIGGAPVIGQTLSGSSDTFVGNIMTEGDEWQVSGDGTTGWNGTGTTGAASPALAGGMHYRLASTATNSGGSLTTCSEPLGPAVAPVIGMSGLVDGEAVIGDHASITMHADQGTITARKWGSASGGSQYGTGANPADFAAGGGETLHATATVGGIDYTVSADIAHAAPAAAGGLGDQDFTVGQAIATLDVAADFTGAAITYALAPSSAPLPTGLNLVPAGQITGTPTTEAAEVVIVVRGTNSGGFADTAFGVTVSAASAAATVDGVTAGAWTGAVQPISVSATGAETGDTVHWVLVPSAGDVPAAAAVAAGQASGVTLRINVDNDERPELCAGLIHVSGASGILTTRYATGTGSGGAGGITLDGIDTTAGGLLFAVGTISSVSAAENAGIADDAGNTGTLDAPLFKAIVGTDDVYIGVADEDTPAETGRALDLTYTSGGYNLALMALIVPSV